MYYISFPGLGIEPFHIDRVAFSVFGRNVAWYGIIITCGMILAVLCALQIAKKEQISSDDILDLAFTVIVFGVVGARAYYVLFSWGEQNYLVTSALSDGTLWGSISAFFSNLWGTFVNCIAVWKGGLAIYGGILAGLLSGYIFARIKKIPFLKIFDILAPCVTIGQIIGRWGNFINIEAYGSQTDLPWRMGISYSLDNGATFISEKFVHPTFLYESLWNLAGLAILFLLYKKGKKFNGQSFCTYLIWYGFGRMLIEGLRTDSLMIGNLRVSQCVGLMSFLLGAILMVIFGKKSHLSESTEEYAAVYGKTVETPTEDRADDNLDLDVSEMKTDEKYSEGK